MADAGADAGAAAAGAGAAAPPPEPAVVSSTPQLMTSHATVARFAGLQALPCRHLTSLCPDRCGHAGTLAVFDVVRYLHWAREPGQQYGDERQARHHVRLGGEPGWGAGARQATLVPGLDAALRALAPGTLVRLDWRHDYVTTVWEGGGSAKGPERPVTRLEAFASEEAAAAAAAEE